jgi:hypothetical protein
LRAKLQPPSCQVCHRRFTQEKVNKNLNKAMAKLFKKEISAAGERIILLPCRFIR